MEDIDKREAELLVRLEAERETRIAEKIAAGEIVSVPLYIVAGSEASARAQEERAKADKLAELRAAGDQREVVFAVNVVITGVVQHGEARDPERAPTAPGFASGEDAPPANEVVEEEAREEPPLVETPISVQIRACRDDDDPGEIAEGFFSVDGKVLTVTDLRGGYVGSRTLLEGEDSRAAAKRLLKEKTPEAESFNRPLSYSNAGLA